MFLCGGGEDAVDNGACEARNQGVAAAGQILLEIYLYNTVSDIGSPF